MTTELGDALRRAGFASAVGNTPLVELAHLSPAPGVRLFAKLESENPTGSVKDRVALAMLDAAERSGELRRGRTILEPSSGNTGIALATLGRVRGYPVRIVLPESADERARRAPARRSAPRSSARPASSAPTARSPSPASWPRPIARCTCPSSTPTRRTRTCTTAPRASRSSRTAPTSTRSSPGLGTGGTLMGVGRRLRETNPDVQIVAAEPLAGDDVSGLRSLEDGYMPEVLDVTQLDRKLLVTNAEAVRGLRRLAREEGIFAGVSAGGVLHVALQGRRRARRPRRTS